MRWFFDEWDLNPESLHGYFLTIDGPNKRIIATPSTGVNDDDAYHRTGDAWGSDSILGLLDAYNLTITTAGQKMLMNVAGSPILRLENGNLNIEPSAMLVYGPTLPITGGSKKIEEVTDIVDADTSPSSGIAWERLITVVPTTLVDSSITKKHIEGWNATNTIGTSPHLYNEVSHSLQDNTNKLFRNRSVFGLGSDTIDLFSQHVNFVENAGSIDRTLSVIEGLLTVDNMSFISINGTTYASYNKTGTDHSYSLFNSGGTLKFFGESAYQQVQSTSNLYVRSPKTILSNFANDGDTFEFDPTARTVRYLDSVGTVDGSVHIKYYYGSQIFLAGIDDSLPSISYNGSSWIRNYGNTSDYFGLNAGSILVGSKSYNTGVGYASLSNLLIGDRNVSFGANSGRGIANSSDNVFVGANAGYFATSIGDHNRNIIIGSNALNAIQTVALNDKLWIQTSSSYSSKALLSGDMSLYRLSIGFDLSTTNWTDLTRTLTTFGGVKMISTSEGLIISNMTTTQRDAIVAPELSEIIYNTTTGTFQYRDGSPAWVDLATQQWVNDNDSTYSETEVRNAINLTNGLTWDSVTGIGVLGGAINASTVLTLDPYANLIINNTLGNVQFSVFDSGDEPSISEYITGLTHSVSRTIDTAGHLFSVINNTTYLTEAQLAVGSGYVRVEHGNFKVDSLKTLGTSPSPTGATKSVLVDENGMFVFGDATVIGGSGNYIQNQFVSAQPTASFWISGSAKIGGTFEQVGAVDQTKLISSSGFMIQSQISNSTWVIDVVNKSMIIQARGGNLTLGTNLTGNISINSGGNTIVSKLSGTGNRLVQADATGVLSATIPVENGGSYIWNQVAAQQPMSNFWISGDGRVDGNLRVGSYAGANSSLLLVGATGATSEVTSVRLRVEPYSYLDFSHTASMVKIHSPHIINITTTNTSPILFGINGAEAARINNSGNVLIGTTSDTGYKLNVSGTGNFSSTVYTPSVDFHVGASSTFYLGRTGTDLDLKSAGGLGVYSNQTNMYIGGIVHTRFATDGIYTFNISNATGDFVTRDGNGLLHIRTAAQTLTDLNLPNGGNYIWNQDSVIQTATFRINNRGIIESSLNDGIKIINSGTDYASISLQGGTRTNAQRLQIGQYTNGDGFFFHNGSYGFVWSNGGGEAMRIASTRNVLIGTTSDLGHTLRVNGNTYFSGGRVGIGVAPSANSHNSLVVLHNDSQHIARFYSTTDTSGASISVDGNTIGGTKRKAVITFANNGSGKWSVGIDEVVSTSNQNLHFYNSQILATPLIIDGTTSGITASSLAGTGNRLVQADSTGLLSATIPVENGGSYIWNQNLTPQVANYYIDGSAKFGNTDTNAGYLTISNQTVSGDHVIKYSAGLLRMGLINADITNARPGYPSTINIAGSSGFFHSGINLDATQSNTSGNVTGVKSKITRTGAIGITHLSYGFHADVSANAGTGYGVYSSAVATTGIAYSFYGEAGLFYNANTTLIGHTASQGSQLLQVNGRGRFQSATSSQYIQVGSAESGFNYIFMTDTSSGINSYLMNAGSVGGRYDNALSFATTAQKIAFTYAGSGGNVMGYFQISDGTLNLNYILNATVDPDKILVSDGGKIKYMSKAQLDIAPASGSGNYIQNQTTADQVASFRISGTGQALHLTLKGDNSGTNHERIYFNSATYYLGRNVGNTYMIAKFPGGYRFFDDLAGADRFVFGAIAGNFHIGTTTSIGASYKLQVDGSIHNTTGDNIFNATSGSTLWGNNTSGSTQIKIDRLATGVDDGILKFYGNNFGGNLIYVPMFVTGYGNPSTSGFKSVLKVDGNYSSTYPLIHIKALQYNSYSPVGMEIDMSRGSNNSVNNHVYGIKSKVSFDALTTHTGNTYAFYADATAQTGLAYSFYGLAGLMYNATVPNATVDPDKIMVWDAGVYKYMTRTQLNIAPATGSANYIQNQQAADQTANWRIDGQARQFKRWTNNAPTYGAGTTNGLSTYVQLWGNTQALNNYYAATNILRIEGFNGTLSPVYSSGGVNNQLSINSTIFSAMSGQNLTANTASVGVTGNSNLSHIVGLESYLEMTSGSTITNYYGVYIRAASSGTITNNYAIFQETATSKNYFSGQILKGVTSSTYDVDLIIPAAAGGGFRVKQSATASNQQYFKVENGSGAVHMYVNGTGIVSFTGANRVSLSNIYNTGTERGHIWLNDNNGGDSNGLIQFAGAIVSGGGVHKPIFGLINNRTAAVDEYSYFTLIANRTTGGKTRIADIGALITDIDNVSYKGALIFSTADAAAPIERMRIDHTGLITAQSLNDSTGIAKMVVTTNGVLSYQDIPSGGSSNTTSIIAVTGTQDGSNRVFTLAVEPVSGSVLMLFVNGQLVNDGYEYTRVGDTITFDSAYPAPVSTTILIAYGVIL